MGRNRAGVWLAAALGLLLAAGGAGAAFVDQSQPLLDGGVPPFVVGGSAGQELAQTLTAGMTGRLAAVRLPVGCASGAFTLQVREVDGAAPGQTVVASLSLPAENLPPSPSVVGFRTFAVPGTPFFAAGERFALVLSASGTCEVAAGPLGNPYPRGEGLYRDRSLGPSAWLPLGPRSDLPFETLVEAGDPFPPFSDDRVTGFVAVRCFLSALVP
ncbi:MAG: hypothetical protein SCH98_05775 [Deferrisomatales bacterium]|nr:hypothetical protein [Deferrisomatales bacterium]